MKRIDSKSDFFDEQPVANLGYTAGSDVSSGEFQ
jgi:hypothetical protein